MNIKAIKPNHSSAMKDVFVKIQENTIGPLSEAKIRTLIDQGVFSRRDLVWSKKEDKWVPVDSHSELTALFKSADHPHAV